jgi:phosphate transport system permease protein
LTTPGPVRRRLGRLRRDGVAAAFAVVVLAVSGTAFPSRLAAADESPSPVTSEATELIVMPSILDLTPGATTVIEFTADTPVPVTSVTADILFDQSKIAIRAIEPGPAWAGGLVQAGEAGASLDEALAVANRSGRLPKAGMYLLPGMGELPTGKNVVARITVEALAGGQTQLAVSEGLVLDESAAQLPVAGGAGVGLQARDVVVSPGPNLPLILALLLLVCLVPFIAVGTGAVPAHRLREGPYVASVILGLIPVAIFAGFVILLVVNAIPALTTPGLQAMLAGTFTSQFTLAQSGVPAFGLLPAAWGTILVTVIAIVIALPVSLAMAIVVTEFPAGPLGRILRPLLSLFSGIPPIVYAVAGAIFVTIFVAPKFAGSVDRTSFNAAALGVAPGTWPPADVPFTDTSFPWSANVGGLPSSTLLGGILIALLVIPFMTPLIHDAMRNVPTAAREASLALGANRWYTVRRVMLPLAMPGIVAAVGLATLKALGDVLIVALAVGWTAETLPNPLVDVFEKTSTLAAEGANLLGNLQAATGGACDAKGSACGVGYSAALVLLAAAALVVVATSFLEGRLRRRLHT